jgi:hypothetical protein
MKSAGAAEDIVLLQPILCIIVSLLIPSSVKIVLCCLTQLMSLELIHLYSLSIGIYFSRFEVMLNTNSYIFCYG